MKQIPLSQGYFAKVDDDDYDWLMQWKWCACLKKSGIVYAYRADYKAKPKTIIMHRVILGVTDPKTLVDHGDRDGLNNQRWNIRLATKSQNSSNTKVRKDNQCGYKGVWFDKNRGLYVAEITKDGVGELIGASKCPKACARSYNKKAIDLFGIYARVNEIEDGPLAERILLRPTNSSGYRGVSWNKQRQKWCVSFRNKNVFLKVAFFEDIIVAAKNYDQKAFNELGPKARLNFPEDYP